MTDPWDVADRNAREARALATAAQARMDQVGALYHEVMHEPWGCDDARMASVIEVPPTAPGVGQQ